MELIYQLKLPFPPSVNGLYGGGSKQQRFKTERYKKWCKNTGYIPPLNFDFPIHIEYTFIWPDARIRDGSNHIKCLGDLFVNAKLISDDNWKIIQSEEWNHKGIDKKNAGVEIKIFKI